MFTIKMYDGSKCRILEAESFTVIGNHSSESLETPQHWSEITLHNRGEDIRYDVGDSPMRNGSGDIQVYRQAYIENAAGKTVASYNYGLKDN